MPYSGKNKYIDAVAELGWRNPFNKHQIQPEYGDKQAGAGRGCRNPPRETKFIDANGYRENPFSLLNGPRAALVFVQWLPRFCAKHYVPIQFLKKTLVPKSPDSGDFTRVRRAR